MFAFILRGNNRSMYVANINPYAGTSNYYTFKAVVVRQAAPPQPTESRRFRPPEETEKLYDVGVPMPATQDIGEFDTLYRITGSNIEPIDLRSTLPWQRTHAARGNAKAQLDLAIRHLTANEVPLDRAEAIRLLKLAAPRSSTASAKLAELEKGFITTR